MKKILLPAIIIMLCITLFGCKVKDNEVQQSHEIQLDDKSQSTDKSDRETIEKLIKDFGSKIQTIPLLAPQDVLKKSIKETYSSFISPTLLEEWLSDPKKVPGRLTSSPWPDRIEISSIQRISEDSYEVKGKIIEITSVEKESGGAAAKRPITLIVKKIDENWLIDDVTLEEYK
jgi:hypothetical protein